MSPWRRTRHGNTLTRARPEQQPYTLSRSSASRFVCPSLAIPWDIWYHGRQRHQWNGEDDDTQSVQPLQGLVTATDRSGARGCLSWVRIGDPSVLAGPHI